MQSSTPAEVRLDDELGATVWVGTGHLREVCNGNTLNAYMAPNRDRFADVPLYDQAAIDAAVALAADRYSELMLAVEWMLAEGGNMNQEHLARIRAAWERA